MANRFLFLIVLLGLFTSIALAQQVYQWKDEKGQWHLSYSPPPGVTAEKVGGLGISPKSIQPATVPTTLRSPSSADKPPAALPQSQPRRTQPVSSPQKIVVPFGRDRDRVIVEGTVNGRGPLKFLLDTGADITSIPRALAEQLGISVDRGIRIPVRGIGGKVMAPLVEIDSLRVGEAEVRNLAVLVMSLPGGRGLLGANFLAEFEVNIKYGENQLMLMRRQGPYAGFPPEWWQRKIRFYRKGRAVQDAEESYLAPSSPHHLQCCTLLP